MSARIMRATFALLLCGTLGAVPSQAQEPPAPTRVDGRIRTVVYSADEIYRLRGFVGYQIDLEFERGESFLGLGAGDVDALSFATADNHLFIKPKAAKVRTNLTVLTNRRIYQFDYDVTSTAGPEVDPRDVIYTLRFAYPGAAGTAPARAEADRALDQSIGALYANRDYWYCGHAALQPLEAFDDGVHTHLRFDPDGELPALFLGNDDGTESLLNFSIQQGEVVIHRVARRFIVRRGKLNGCIVNHGFVGTGRELHSGTVTDEVERATRTYGP